ncbi:DUF3987 domain-containing protein [Variovorax sp. J22P168]|uniref:DUF3987 domain-containing protein n=1 Tax=Variovorax jilinensis TaxID=3053513 RepID=UPI002574A517|nr:DUF3987 domain-containing protein [Variovorax sp. J22P168]MDM0010884.1 DUF3987 domain-containing protein [Variovorax sp. J22P168]
MNREAYERQAAILDAHMPPVPRADDDNHRNAPRPDLAALYGLVGDVARAGSHSTEANPFAIALNFIAYMSCAVGRGPYMSVANTCHHARQFTLHIGRSGRGRKGDAVSLVGRIAEAVKEVSEHGAPKIHRGGLSTREGLAFLIHDGYKDGKDEVPAEEDKRLWVIESEFANVLHQGKREGNTLSAALRDLWDGVSIKPATKANRLSATAPHVCLSGAVTPSELRSLMAARELTNGFANRFLMIWAERTKMLPFPTPTSQETVDALARRVVQVLEFCRAREWVNRDHMSMELTPPARERYGKLYMGELNDTSAGERISSLVERRAPMLLRLAMLFALCDLQSAVDVPHVQAALAWVRYSVESVKFVFASATEESEAAEVNDAAQKIIDFLRVRGRATRTELTVDCFRRHSSKSLIDAALDALLLAAPPRLVVTETPRPKGSPGTPTKSYQLTGANCANSANSDNGRGKSDNRPDSEFSEVCERSSGLVGSVRTLREQNETPQGVAGPNSSRTSQSSHGFSEADAGVAQEEEL